MKNMWRILIACFLIVSVVGTTIVWMNWRYIKEPELDPAILERIDLSEKSEAQRNYIMDALKQEYENRPDICGIELHPQKNLLVMEFALNGSEGYMSGERGIVLYLDLFKERDAEVKSAPLGDELTKKEGQKHIQFGNINEHYYEVYPYYYSEQEVFFIRVPGKIYWQVELRHAFGGFQLMEVADSVQEGYGMKILEEFSLKYEEILKNCPKE